MLQCFDEYETGVEHKKARHSCKKIHRKVKPFHSSKNTTYERA